MWKRDSVKLWSQRNIVDLSAPLKCLSPAVNNEGTIFVAFSNHKFIKFLLVLLI